MVDFSALVIGPAMAVFGRPITVTPAKSQPNQPAYQARGIYRAQSIDMQADDGAPVATTKHTLGIRRASFAVQIRGGDTVTLDDGRVFFVDRVHPDGQGGSELTLKQTEQGPSTP